MHRLLRLLLSRLGNQGNVRQGGAVEDIEHGGNVLDDDLGGGERDLVRALREKTGAIVITVYPYGLGLGGNSVHDPLFGIDILDSNRNLRDAVYPSAYDNSRVPGYKADEIFAHVAGLNPYVCNNLSNVRVDNNKLNVTFVAYSGGGQMAYSTAQKLQGRLFVDNLVTFGSSFRAYGGMSNIGRLWSFVGEQDTFYGNLGETVQGWEQYNAGYPISEKSSPFNLQAPRYNIYQHGATRCTLLGTEDRPYEHFYSYFDRNTAFTGVSCQGSYAKEASGRTGQVPLDWIAQKGYASRFDANSNFLVEVIEGRLK